MGSRLRNNLPLKLLALFLAFAIWGYVRYTQSSWAQVNSHAILEIPLLVENVASELVVIEAPRTVSLNIKGHPEALEDIKISDFAAYLDLRGKGEGPYNLRAEVKVPKGIKLEDIPQVMVQLDKIDSRKFDVKVHTLGSLPLGKILEGLDVKPSVVTVKGPKSMLDQVKTVEASANLSTAESTIILRSLAVPVDKENLAVDKLECDPKYVTVEVKIQSRHITMTLPVKPELTGEPAKGFKVKEVIVYPPVITVDFKERPEGAVEYISVKPLDIKGKKSTFSSELELVPPPGGTILGQKKVMVKTVFTK